MSNVSYLDTLSEAYTISKIPNIVDAIPIAGPFTIAIKSFGYIIIASIKSLQDIFI